MKIKLAETRTSFTRRNTCGRTKTVSANQRLRQKTTSLAGMPVSHLRISCADVSAVAVEFSGWKVPARGCGWLSAWCAFCATFGGGGLLRKGRQRRRTGQVSRWEIGSAKRRAGAPLLGTVELGCQVASGGLAWDCELRIGRGWCLIVLCRL